MKQNSGGWVRISWLGGSRSGFQGNRLMAAQSWESKVARHSGSLNVTSRQMGLPRSCGAWWVPEEFTFDPEGTGSLWGHSGQDCPSRHSSLQPMFHIVLLLPSSSFPPPAAQMSVTPVLNQDKRSAGTADWDKFWALGLVGLSHCWRKGGFSLSLSAWLLYLGHDLLLPSDYDLHHWLSWSPDTIGSPGLQAFELGLEFISLGL